MDLSQIAGTETLAIAVQPYSGLMPSSLKQSLWYSHGDPWLEQRYQGD